MKKLYFFLTAVLFANLSTAQTINFPDANFKAVLVASTPGLVGGINQSVITVDANGDGEIQVSEAQAIHYLHLNSVDVSDLTGIEYFTNLTWLICQFHNITSLNISNLPNLTILECSYGQLETLNISNLPNLEYLACSNNFITSLDLTGLTNIKKLYCSNNQLTSLDVNGITNLQELYCGNNLITTLSISNLNTFLKLVCDGNGLTSLNLTNLNSLGYLTCNDNMLTTIDLAGLTNLWVFSCDNNQINNLGLLDQLINLESFSCSNNQITSLDLSNLPNLDYLNCESNQITSLTIASSPNLQILYCGNNLLTALNLDGLTGLQQLYCSDNQLTALSVSNMPDLHQFWCFNNQITSLTVINLPNLTELFCHNNQIDSLDLSAMPNLSRFGCWNNNFTSLALENLPFLTQLYCNSNQLTSLDLSNKPFLTELNCSNNNLTSLDFSQANNIQTLDCSYNHFSTLDANMLTSLQEVYCTNINELISVSAKNGRNEEGSFSGNPNLQYICADESQVVAIEVLVFSYGYTNCHVNSYCTFTPGGEFYAIEGNNKLDYNNDGCDSGDTAVPNLKLLFTSGTTTANVIPDISGDYHYYVQAGTHTIQPIIENPAYFNISPTSATVTFPDTAGPFVQDFCVTANGTHNDLEIVLLPIELARPGFDANYKIVYKNKGTTIQNGTVNLTFDDSVTDLLLANPSTSVETVNSLTWNFTNLMPLETREIELTFNLNSPVETPPLNSGDFLNYTATVTADIDEMPSDNISSLSQRVVNGYDPNDKTCLEGDSISSDMIGQYVHYIIRFENTGTAEAVNIVVKDVINTARFDISSLIPLSGSHPFVTRITSNNRVEFIFENINLPFDDANNDGYVAFKIKTKPNLVVGNTFSNKASIYFDYNFPIVTNTATTTIQLLGNIDFDFNTIFSLSPVPTKNTLTITAKQEVVMSSISIYNTLGQLMQVIANPNETIDVTDLKPGSYFVKIQSDKGSSVGKFIKE